jgi:hypothetical protein
LITFFKEIGNFLLVKHFSAIIKTFIFAFCSDIGSLISFYLETFPSKANFMLPMLFADFIFFNVFYLLNLLALDLELA